MDSEKMGAFIAELRKSLQLTQKDLAEKLNVSDKAVSKWERGLSCPDIALLTPLSEILGVTTTELLNAEKSDARPVDVETVVVKALEYGEKNVGRVQLSRSIIAAAFSGLLLIGILVVLIVDVATSGGFTWSPISVAGCVFAWIVAFPILRFAKRGIIATLIAVSVFVIPFLYVLDVGIGRLVGTETLVFAIGIRIAPLSVAFIWIAYLLFTKLKLRALTASAILVLCTSPISYFTNAMIADMLDQPTRGAEVILNTVAPVVVAAILLIVGFIWRKKAR